MPIENTNGFLRPNMSAEMRKEQEPL